MSTSETRKPVDPTAPSQRFLFETSFDSEAIGGTDEEPPEPTFSADELEQARQAAYTQGEAAGREDAVNSIEKQLLNGLGRLVEQMAALSDDQARYQQGLTGRSVELALKAIRKMFPALALRDGLVEIEAVLADCLQEARAEPRIAVRVAEDQVAPLLDRIDTLAATAGHDGKITVQADNGLGPADCRVEWADGGAERVVDRLWQEFEAATQRIFQSPGDEPAELKSQDVDILEPHVSDAEPGEPRPVAPEPALAVEDTEIANGHEPASDPTGEPPGEGDTPVLPDDIAADTPTMPGTSSSPDPLTAS